MLGPKGVRLALGRGGVERPERAGREALGGGRRAEAGHGDGATVDDEGGGRRREKRGKEKGKERKGRKVRWGSCDEGSPSRLSSASFFPLSSQNAFLLARVGGVYLSSRHPIQFIFKFRHHSRHPP